MFIQLLLLGIGIGVELVTVDTYIAELVPKHVRGRAFAKEAYLRISMVGIALVLLLFFIGLSNDVGGHTG